MYVRAYNSSSILTIQMDISQRACGHKFSAQSERPVMSIRSTFTRRRNAFLLSFPISIFIYALFIPQSSNKFVYEAFRYDENSKEVFYLYKMPIMNKNNETSSWYFNHDWVILDLTTYCDHRKTCNIEHRPQMRCGGQLDRQSLLSVFYYFYSIFLESKQNNITEK